MQNNQPIYRVKNWAENFENNRTREMVAMKWVPVPNKHDGEGYRTIIQEPDGIVIFGCWNLILQVASKSHPRGTLLRDDGTPLTAKAISVKTGWRKVQDIERALAFCSSPEVDWLEVVTQDGALIPQEGASIPQEGARKGMEGNRRELKGMEDLLCDFSAFWTAYPRKIGKQAALKAWQRATGKPPIQAIIEAIRQQAQSEQWRKDGGQYIPHPATWLNQGRWDDKPEIERQQRVCTLDAYAAEARAKKEAERLASLKRGGILIGYDDEGFEDQEIPE